MSSDDASASVEASDSTPLALRPETPVQVWALLSWRSGENQQILGLAEALERNLGWRVRIVPPQWTWQGSLRGLLRHTTLAGVSAQTRASFGARTPDVVISAGLRNEPVVRWLQRRSGRRTVSVILGRTWTPEDRFDLVVTTPQYRLRRQRQVLENPGTLHRVSAARLDAARHEFSDRYAPLPGPRLGVLIGGDSGPFCMGRNAARHLVARARALADGGSVIATTSSRTPAVVRRELGAALSGAGELWDASRTDARSSGRSSGRSSSNDTSTNTDPDAGRRGENPYFGILAWADALLVTGDSIAMVSEAIATGKPVRIFDIGGMRAETAFTPDRSLRSRCYSLLMRLGPAYLSRDLVPVHQGFIARGLARWDSEPLGELGATEHQVRTDYVDATVQRVAELVADRRR